MQLKRRGFYVLFLLGMALSGFAQQDSVHLIDQVLIQAEVRTIHLHQGLKHESIDSTTLANSLNLSAAEILNRMSSVYIKSYGGSGLASSSFRGGSANHTAILWNGFNLQSPVTGMMDLSLIPAGLFNSMSLQYGGKSAVWGSGAVGGAIHLRSQADFNTGTSAKLFLGAGSFNEKSMLAAATYSNMKFSNSTKIYHHQSLHNYDYLSLAREVNEVKKLPNAASEQNTLMQENYFKIKENQLLETHIWLQENKRLLPPTLYQESSDAFQEDRAMRFTGSYKRYFNKWNFNFRSAFFNEELKYKDSEFSKVSENKSQTFIHELLINHKIGRNTLILGGNNTYAKAQSNDLTNYNPVQNKMAVFSSFEYLQKNGNLSGVATLRQEWVNTTQVPLTWTLGIDYYLTHWLKSKLNASRVYRVPTINDLFWKEGGNTSLLPENGYAYEGGIMLILPKRAHRYTLSVELTAFRRKLENWIIWLPNGNFWSPQNLMEVWSRGAETNTSFELKKDKIKLFSNFKTSYVLSENSTSLLKSDASLNKQLIYIPMYAGQLNYGITYCKATLILNHTYTGYRYTSSDHSQYLEPYFLHNLSLAYQLNFKKVSIDLQFQINNLANTSYQVLAARPMPGINYRGGLVFNFKTNYGKS
ncbi:MAG: TonB-dependent receptor plug domain-containing protein [Bacteroidia bacterium]